MYRPRISFRDWRRNSIPLIQRSQPGTMNDARPKSSSDFDAMKSPTAPISFWPMTGFWNSGFWCQS